MSASSRPKIDPCLSRERIAHHEAELEWPVPGAAAMLAARVRRTPDRLFVVDGARRVTFAEVERLSEALATGLLGLGLGAGDVVSWQLPSWLEGALLTIALDRIGAISNPILPIYREAEVGFVLRQAKARALVVPGVVRGFDHRELARRLRGDAPALEQVFVARAEPLLGMCSFDHLLETPVARPLPPSPFGPHDVSAVFYTSGTTAEPKGVMHTPCTLGAFARVNVTAVGTTGGDVGLLQFPLAHIGGVGAFVLAPMIVGSRVVYLDGWTPEAALERIEREKVTGAGGPPAILQGILASPAFRPERVASVRVAASGAADVSPELIRQVRRRFGAASFRSYGMTECPMLTTGRLDDPEEKCVMTDGRPAPGCRVRIVDEEGNDLPPGKEGEVLAFGPQMCVGYLDARLDADAFTRDGFFVSGDLAVVDEEGFLRVTGRRKDIIIRKGENLSAKAIEDVLYDHPAIADAAVIGVPDHDRGERVCACIVLRPGAAPITLAGLDEFMTARGMMKQKIPEQIEILDELPRNATGKVKKNELRARLRTTAG